MRREDTALDMALGATLRSVVGVVATALTVGAAIAALVGQITAVEDGVPSAARWGGVLAMALLGLAASRARFDDPARVVLDRRILEAYVVALVSMGAVFQLGFATTVIIMLFLLLLVMFGSLFSSAAVTSITVLLAVGSHVIGAARASEPDWLAAIGFVVIATVAAIIGRTAGIGYRRAVLAQLDARAVAQKHAARLRRVASAARDVHVLDPERVLSAVADAALAIGWSVCDLQVQLESGSEVVVPRPLRPDGGAGPTAPPHVVAEPTVIGLGEPGRGATAAVWSDGLERSTVSAPVHVRGRRVGSLIVGRRSDPVEDVDVQLVELLAGQAGRALELAVDFEGQRRVVAELERVSELKRDFLGTVSHELRTPLHVVLGMAATLDERWDAMDSELQRHMVGRLHSNASGLEHVIESLLDFSRLEAGAVAPTMRQAAVLPLVEAVLERLEDMLGKHDVAVDTADEPANGPVWADPNLLERVVENLLSNAARHTPAGTSITVRIAQDGRRTLVEVADDGPGIGRADQERIGERFFRGGDPLRRSSRGIGLGLAFCIEVLELHDATLDVVSVAGQGTSFRFSIPRSAATIHV